MITRPYIRQIVEELNRFRDGIDRQGLPDGEWTSGVLSALARAGEHFGYRVAPSRVADTEQKDRDWGEWLYDLVWFDMDENESWESKNRWSVPLVAECEWKTVKWEIQQDFEKLLLARAALRVMVYDRSGRNRLSPKDMCKWVELFEGTQVGDTYLLVTYEGERPFRYHQIVVRAHGAELVELGTGDS